MKKVKYGIVGALIGTGIALVVCTFWAFVICISVGLIVGVAIGHNADQEDAEEYFEAESRRLEQQKLLEQQEQQRERMERIRQRAREQSQAKDENELLLTKWQQEVLMPAVKAFYSIEIFMNVDSDGKIVYTKPFYDVGYAEKCQKRLNEVKAEAAIKDQTTQFVSYQELVDSVIGITIETIHKHIQKDLHEFKNKNFTRRGDLPGFLCSLAYLTDDKRYLDASEAAYAFYIGTFEYVTHINPVDYGNVTTPVDTDEKMQIVASKVLELETKIRTNISHLDADPDQHYSCIVKNLYREMSKDAETIMWYYAKKKPFDSEKFESACELYGAFTRMLDTQAYESREMIARIYAKQSIGGENLVEADRKMIEQWIQKTTDDGINYNAQRFASALAWMDLYHMELNVLKQLVQEKVQIHENLQERLRFLAEGGASNIKVYDISADESFMFDSSSENWNEKDIATCFRNLKMKKLSPHYSLVLSSWKKTMPLSSGQKISMGRLHADFETLLKDFDNEIVCKKIDAKAVDLNNLEYHDAILFKFTSERNRCVNMLFHCDKFGRNLNVTILTLFTPEDGLSLEEMEKYAIAIKSNVYVESFRESILQTVDEVIKDKVMIYDETNKTNPQQTIFE